MKIRRSILFFVIIIMTLICLMLWHKREVEVKSLSAILPETNSVLPRPATTGRPSETSSVESPVTVPTNAGTPAMTNKGDQIKEGLGKLNDADITFYGQVVDQFTNVVSDATVNFGVRIYNSSESTVKYGETKSDASGLFTISGYKGESLGLGVKKAGYVFVAMQGSGVYSYMWPDEQRAHPDITKPTVIKMWKLQGAETLIDISKEYKLAFVDKPIYFDLVTGSIVLNGGDLKITVHRPEGVISQQHPQNWSIDFEVVGGGFIKTSPKDSAITFVAPEDGYQQSDVFGNNNGPDMVDQSFFIKSRNGQIYSKVHLLFRVNDAPTDLMNVTFQGVANTNSSRNWEATIPR